MGYIQSGQCLLYEYPPVRRAVYLGGVSYQAGQCVDIEAADMAQETRAVLRSAENGVKNFSHYPGHLSDLIAASVSSTLAAARRSVAEIEVVCVMSSMIDARNNTEPQWLADLANRLGMQTVPFYAIGLADCAGFHAGLRLAAALVAAGDIENALLLSFDQAGDALQRVYGEGTDFVYVTGDSAASCVISQHAHDLRYELRGPVQYTSNTRQIEHFSDEVDMRSIAALSKKTYQQANIPAHAIGHFICNNYTLEATRLFCRLSGLSPTKAATRQLPRYAHCFSSDNLINLTQLQHDDELRAGDHLLLFSTGPFQSGACIITCMAP